MENTDIVYMYNQTLHDERVRLGRIASITTFIVAPLFYLKDVYMTEYVQDTFFWRMLPVVLAVYFFCLTLTKFKHNFKVVKYSYFALIYGVLVMMLGVFYINYNTQDGRFNSFLIAGLITTLLIIQLFSSPIRKHIAAFALIVVIFFVMVITIKGGDAFLVSNLVNPTLTIVLISVLSYIAEKKSFSEYKVKFLLELNERALRDEIEYRKVLEAQLKDEALHDLMTGVYNKRAAEVLLPEKIAHLQEWDLSYALVYIDLDNLKDINDTYGHDRGDAYLRAFTKTARECLKAGVSIYRVGGDEFVVLLEEMDRESAVMVMDEISEICQSHEIGFSYGIATQNDEGLIELADLIKDADIRMYNQKQRKKVALESA